MARTSSVAGSASSSGLEESHWLCPIEDRRRLDSAREGMVEEFSLGNFASTRQRLREVGLRLGLKRVPNLGGCPGT